jgi:two-component system KDP operon response regulator KdpE
MSAVRQRILIIDDEPQIHRFLGPALDAAGYEPLRADSGQEGLRGIALWSPDAVVLDLGLPDMDGKDVLEKARAFYEGPILILSARDREAEKIEALDRAPTTMWKSRSESGSCWRVFAWRCASAAPPGAHRGDPRRVDVEIDLEKRW